MKKRPVRISVAAYHQAGHAVVAHHYGVAIERAHITSNQSGEVHYVHGIYSGEAGPQAALDVSLGGMVAEGRFVPGSWYQHFGGLSRWFLEQPHSFKEVFHDFNLSKDFFDAFRALSHVVLDRDLDNLRTVFFSVLRDEGCELIVGEMTKGRAAVHLHEAEKRVEAILTEREKAHLRLATALQENKRRWLSARQVEQLLTT
jgi:hypothetical protein